MATLGVVVALPREAQAETISIRFETFAEEPPEVLCVVGAFVPKNDSGAPGLDGASTDLFDEKSHFARGSWSAAWDARYDSQTRALVLGPSREKVDRQGAAPMIVAPKSSSWGRRPPRYYCRRNDFGKREGEETFAVLLVDDAIVQKVQLAHEVATLELMMMRKREDRPIQLQLIGGSYLEQVALSVMLAKESQRVDVALIPRAVRRRLSRSEFHCDADTHEASPIDSSLRRLPGSGGTAEGQDYQVLLGGPISSEIGLRECGHEFTYSSSSPVPPEPIQLQPSKFWFDWVHHCLAPPRECPSVSWPSSDVECHAVGGVHYGQCRYVCKGPARFPAKGVRFIYRKLAGTPSWEEEISYPGIRVRGYVPREERRVPLRWAWPRSEDINGLPFKQREPQRGLLRERRADLPGDELEYVSLTTPEGREHRVHFRASQIRVPELDCGDYLSYRYVGARSFEERQAEIDPVTGIELADPDTLHRSWVNIGFIAGAGLRFLPGQDVKLGPQLDLALFFALRGLTFQSGAGLIEPDIGIGAILANQPYHSCVTRVVTGATSEETCESQSIRYWRARIEPGFRWYASNKWSLVTGVGLAYGIANSRREAPLVHESFMLTGHLGLVYEILHSIALQGQLRGFAGDQYKETSFDQGGVLRSGAVVDMATWSLFPALLLRLDDLL